jgi:acyl-CoA synthetase (AMP-forming)/AMP-acid ligase II
MDAEAAANAYAELVQEGGEFEVGSVRIGSRVVPAFLRAPPTLPQYFARGFVEHRDATFIVYENERLTFGEFERRAALLAHELMVVHDVRPGDRCAVSMRNMPEWAIAFCAASAIGAVVVPLNSWWQMKEMEYGLSDSGAKVLVCDAERHRRAAPSLRKLGIAAIVARATAAEAVDIRAAGDVLFDDALRVATPSRAHAVPIGEVAHLKHLLPRSPLAPPPVGAGQREALREGLRAAQAFAMQRGGWVAVAARLQGQARDEMEAWRARQPETS